MSDSRANQGLASNAANIYSRTLEQLAFDDRGPKPLLRQLLRQWRPSLPCTDDDRIDFFYAANLSSCDR